MPWDQHTGSLLANSFVINVSAKIESYVRHQFPAKIKLHLAGDGLTIVEIIFEYLSLLADGPEPPVKVEVESRTAQNVLTFEIAIELSLWANCQFDVGWLVPGGAMSQALRRLLWSRLARAQLGPGALR